MTEGREPLDPEVLIRVIEAIAADDETSARLDVLDENGVRDELLSRYRAEAALE